LLVLLWKTLRSQTSSVMAAQQSKQCKCDIVLFSCISLLANDLSLLVFSVYVCWFIWWIKSLFFSTFHFIEYIVQHCSDVRTIFWSRADSWLVCFFAIQYGVSTGCSMIMYDMMSSRTSNPLD
jgi:hypothetical protein